MRCPRVCADSISAKVESPATLIDSSGSIWTATVNGMRFSGSSIELLACYADKSPDPRILDMAGARARRQQDHVDAYVVARPGIARHEDLGRRGGPKLRRPCGHAPLRLAQIRMGRNMTAKTATRPSQL